MTERREGSVAMMQRSYIWTVPTAVIAVLALIIAVNTASDRGRGGAGSEVTPGPVAVHLSELKIEPATINVTAGGPVVLDVTNDGAVEHNLALPGHGRTEMIKPGGRARLDLGLLEAGSYQIMCEVPGHAAAGMTATLVVGGSTASAGAAPGVNVDAEYLAGVRAFPAKTDGTGNVAMDPKLDNGVKVFDLKAEQIQWESEVGKSRDAMAFNRQIPGPLIRVNQGDRVRLVLRNRMRESTALHVHGVDLPFGMDGVPGITQDLVEPGKDFAYEFTANAAGSYMYHSHMNAAVQVPKGLLGAFIVMGSSEPKVDLDQVVVLNDGPLGYTINGKGFPATRPVVAAPGQVIRLRYFNEGLQGHPMHLHGMVQTVMAKDGHPLPQPYQADTIWIAPGERYDTLITARAGIWAFHCHILTHAEGERGMFGMVTALVVK